MPAWTLKFEISKMSVIPGVSGVTSMLARDSLHSSLLHTCLGVEVAYRRYEYGDHVPQVLVLAGPRDVHLLGGHPGVKAGAGQHHPVAGLAYVHGLILTPSSCTPPGTRPEPSSPCSPGGWGRSTCPSRAGGRCSRTGSPRPPRAPTACSCRRART